MPFSSSQKSVAAGLEVKVAGVRIDSLGRRWDASKHPRDSRGRFIETGGIARVGLGGLGRVVRSLIGGKIEVEMADGDHRIVPHQQLTMVRRPDGSKPTASVRKVVEEDARRENDANRGDGKLDRDAGDTNGDGVVDAKDDVLADPKAKPQDRDADNPYDGDDDDPEIPEVPDAYAPSRYQAKAGDLIALTRKDKNGQPRHVLGKIDSLDADGKPHGITLAGGRKAKPGAAGMADDYTVIPFEDIADPAALLADAQDDDGKHATLDNELATDLVEGHSNAARAPRGTPRTDKTTGGGKVEREPITSESLIMGRKPGTIEHDGRVVGRIEKGEDGKFRGFDQWGRPTRPAAKWDTARDQLAKLLNSPPEKKKDHPKPAPAKAAAADEPRPAAVTERIDAPEQTPEQVTQATEQVAKAQPKAYTKARTSTDSPANVSQSGNLVAIKEGRQYGVYRRTDEALPDGSLQDRVVVNDKTYVRVGEARTLGEFRDQWLGTDRDMAAKPRSTEEHTSGTWKATPEDGRPGEFTILDGDGNEAGRIREAGDGTGTAKGFLRDEPGVIEGADVQNVLDQAHNSKPTPPAAAADEPQQRTEADTRLPKGAQPQDNSEERPAPAKSPAKRTPATLPQGAQPQSSTTERPNDTTDQDYPGATTPEGAPDEPVRSDGAEVLGDVPAVAGGVDERPDGLLRGPEQAGGGADRGGVADAAAPAAGSDAGADRGDAPSAPVRGDRDGAGRPGVPDAGAGDRGQEAAGDRAARVERGDADGGDARPVAVPTRLKAGPSVAKNIAALRTLRQLETEGRPATATERKILAGWSGWGALPKVFAEDDPTYAKERAELKQLMSEDEWRKARTNMLNAHYTDPKLVEAIWDGVKDLGFTGGDVLEPGSGSGNFIGAAPKGTHMTGVEVEPITAGIARHLHPDADIHLESFAKSPFRSNVFDAVIGNVPFGQFQLLDRRHNKGNHSIHNHFIVKSLDTLKPGGVMAVVTSSYTLDAQDDRARREMFEQADLIGAVRLPENTHAGTAGTSVVTDVLLFRKRKDGEPTGDDSWLNTSPATDKDGNPVVGLARNGQEPQQQHVNDYFTDHPDDMLGELRSGGYNGLKVVGKGDVPAQLRDRLTDLAAQAKAAGRGHNPDDGDRGLAKRDAGSTREGRITFRGVEPNDKGKDALVFERIEDGRKQTFEVPATQAEEFRALLELRDLYDALMVAESEAAEDDDDTMAAARAALRNAYRRYVNRFGPVSRYEVVEGKNGNVNSKYPPVMGKFRQDEGAAVVYGLESDFDPETGKAKEADVLHTRQLNVSRAVAEHTDDPADAIVLAGERPGGLSNASLAHVLQTTPAKARKMVSGLVFNDPAQNGQMVSKAAYLSGNVRRKLAEARAAAENDPAYAENVTALEAVLPKDAELGDIPLQLGSPFIGPDVVTRFARHLMGRGNDVEVEYDEGQWKVPTPKQRYGRNAQLESATWGTGDRSFYQLLEAILKGQHRIIRITRRNEDGTTWVDKKAGEEAALKAQEIEQEFQDWVWAQPDVGDAITRAYTDKHRSLVPRTYDDAPTRAYPGMTAHISPRAHQNAAITRGVNEPAVMFEHVVGAGKTYTLAGLAMELRRLGLARKPVLAVPNHMLAQWTAEFRELYPNAKILAADSDALSGKDGRKRFAAMAANNDWDVVLMTHTAFESIPTSKDWEEKYLYSELDRYQRQLMRAQENRDQRREKQIQTQLEKLKKKIEDRLSRRKDDDGITFESIGFDYVMADEAHVYKNLDFQTGMQGIQSPEGSGRARDMHMKLELLRDQKPSDGTQRIAAFATGTPISNSLAEMYTMTRFMRPDLLDEAGVGDFDAWAATFATVTAKVEQDTSANGWVERVRMRGFTDALGDALRIWRTFSDTKTAKDLNLPRPTLKGGERKIHVVEPSDAQLEALASFKNRVDTLPGGKPKKGDDTHVAIIGDGRRAAIDPRLMSARGLERAGIDPDDDSIDSPKIDQAAATILNIWKERQNDRFKVDHKSDEDAELAGALQMVMIDSDAPKRGQRSSYQMLKDRLIAGGMPADQIRFVQEAAGSSEKKAKLFEDARQGRVAVLMGSTASLGTGTNVQNRLYALHHIDGSWKPSDIEQREGRILRQGNQYGEVEVHAYVTERTHDVKTWDMTAYKQAALDAIAHGSFDMRAVEFADDVDPLTDYDTITGLASGDPLVQDRRDLAPELKRLRAAQTSHRRQIDRAKGVVQQMKQQIRVLTRDKEALTAALARRQDISGDKFTMDLNLPGQWRSSTFTTRKDAAAALGKLVQAKLDEGWMPNGRVPVGVVGQIGGFDVRMSTLNESGAKKKVLFELTTNGNYGEPLPLAAVSMGAEEAKSPEGALSRLENRVMGIENALAKVVTSIGHAESELGAAEAATERTFRFADDLADAERREQLLDKLLTENADQGAGESMQMLREEYAEVTARAKAAEGRAKTERMNALKAEANRKEDAPAPKVTVEEQELADAEFADDVAQAATEDGGSGSNDGDGPAAPPSDDEPEPADDPAGDLLTIDPADLLSVGDDLPANDQPAAPTDEDQAEAEQVEEPAPVADEVPVEDEPADEPTLTIAPEDLPTVDGEPVAEEPADETPGDAEAAEDAAGDVEVSDDIQADHTAWSKLPASEYDMDGQRRSPQTPDELAEYVAGLDAWDDQLDDDPLWMRPTTDYGWQKVPDEDVAPLRETARSLDFEAAEPVELDSKLLRYTAQDLLNVGIVNDYLRDRDTLVDPDGWYGTDVPVVARYGDGYVVLDGTHRVTSDRMAGRPTRAYLVGDAVDEPTPTDVTDDVTEEAREEAIAEAIEAGATPEQAHEAGEVAASVAEADAATEDADVTGERTLVPDPSPEEREEAGAPLTPVQLDGERYPLNPEQQVIADQVVAKGKDVLVRAKAGTGKTSTLEAIARRFETLDPAQKILYICFNKTVQVEADGRMPKNVESRTGHSLAYQWIGRDFTDAKMGGPGKKPTNTVLRTDQQVADYLGVTDTIGNPDGKGFNPRRQAQLALAAVGRFANSADDDLGRQHFVDLQGRDTLEGMSDRDRVRMLGYAKKAWKDIQDPNGQVKTSFDHIRKMWALSKPDLTKVGAGTKRAATVLFLDEAQDTPPVLAKVVADQQMQKVIVGDGDQQIYSFTGAENYLDDVAVDEGSDLPLSTSYRFGPVVADVANRFLQVLGSNERVVGGGSDEGRLVESMRDADAILTRSNGGMLAEILGEQENGRRVGVTKGTKKDLQLFIDTARYLKGQGAAPSVMHEDLAPFDTWQDVEEAIAEDGDPKLTMLDNLIGRFGLDGLQTIIDDVVELDDTTMGAEGGNDLPHGAKVTDDGSKVSIAGAYRLNEFLKQDTGAGLGQFGFRWNRDDKTWDAIGDQAARERALARLRDTVGGGEPTDTPDVVVVTAHKSKGLEWDRVKIGNDFRGPKVNEDTGETQMPEDEELRLAYVAVTRAGKELDPGSLAWVFDHSNENGKEPAAAADAPAANEPAEQSDADSIAERAAQAAAEGDLDAARAIFEEARRIDAERAAQAAADDTRAEEADRGPGPTASAPVVSILGEVAKEIASGESTDETGASLVGFNKPALRSAIDKGFLTQSDTGSSDTEGGRYRLHLTDEGREQLRRALAHGWFPAAGTDAKGAHADDVEAYLNREDEADTLTIAPEDLPTIDGEAPAQAVTEDSDDEGWDDDDEDESYEPEVNEDAFPAAPEGVTRTRRGGYMVYTADDIDLLPADWPDRANDEPTADGPAPAPAPAKDNPDWVVPEGYEEVRFGDLRAGDLYRAWGEEETPVGDNFVIGSFVDVEGDFYLKAARAHKYHRNNEFGLQDRQHPDTPVIRSIDPDALEAERAAFAKARKRRGDLQETGAAPRVLDLPGLDETYSSGMLARDLRKGMRVQGYVQTVGGSKLKAPPLLAGRIREFDGEIDTDFPSPGVRHLSLVLEDDNGDLIGRMKWLGPNTLVAVHKDDADYDALPRFTPKREAAAEGRSWNPEEDENEDEEQRRRRRESRRRYDPTPSPGADSPDAGGLGAVPPPLAPPVGDLPLDGDADPAGSVAGAGDASDAPEAPEFDTPLTLRLLSDNVPAGDLTDAELALVRDNIGAYIADAEARGLTGRADIARRRRDDVLAVIGDRVAASTPADEPEVGPHGGRMVTAGDLRVGDSLMIGDDLYDVDTADEPAGGQRRLVLMPSFAPGVPIGRIERWATDRPVELEPERAPEDRNTPVPPAPAPESAPATGGRDAADWNGGNPDSKPALGRVPVSAGLADELAAYLENGEADGIDQGYTLSGNRKFIVVHDKDRTLSALGAIEDSKRDQADNGDRGAGSLARAARARADMVSNLPDAAPADLAPVAVTSDRVAADQLNVGDVIEGPLASTGDRGRLTVESVQPSGAMMLVTGTNEVGTRDYVRVPAQGLADRVGTGTDTPAWERPVENDVVGQPGPRMPDELAIGDVFEGTGKNTGTWTVVGEPRKTGFMWKVPAEGPDGERRDLNLAQNRPVNVTQPSTRAADDFATDAREVAESGDGITDEEAAELFGGPAATDEGAGTPPEAPEAPATDGDDEDDRPETLVNGALANPLGLTAPADADGDYSPDQIDYLARDGRAVMINVGDEWLPGHFVESATDGDEPVYRFLPVTAAGEDDTIDVPASDLNEVRGVASIETLGEPMDPARLRPGARVAVRRNRRLLDGVLEGPADNGRYQLRDRDGDVHEVPAGRGVRPVLGGYKAGHEPTEAAFAPVEGIWQPAGAGFASAAPGEWVAGIVPDGAGYRWQLDGFSGSAFGTVSGTADTLEAAKEAVVDALYDAAARGGAISMLPGDNEDDRDNRTRELTDTIGEYRRSSSDETPVGDEPTEQTADAPDVNGAPAGWVPTGELEPGDVARVDGENGNGSATTRTGHVLGTPETVEVHSPAGGKPEKGTRTTVGDDRGGLGDRDTVLSPAESMAARAERDPEEQGDSDGPSTAYESQILSGNVGDTMPTDSAGAGIFPGSVVVKNGGDTEGVVNELWDRDVAVRWAGKERDERLRPGLLTVQGEKQNRPHGWTREGHMVKPGHMVELDRGDVGKVQGVSGDDVEVLAGDGETRVVSAGELKVIGRVADAPEPTDAAAAVYDEPPSREGRDVRPVEPIKPQPLPEGAEAAKPNLTPEDLQALTALGVDTDAITPMPVQEAAARVRHGMPITRDQADDLAAWLDRLMASPDVPKGRMRQLRRLRNRIQAAGTRAGDPTARETAPTTAQLVRADDLVRGDAVAVPGPDGETIVGVVRGTWPTQNGQIQTTLVEHADGTVSEHDLLPDGQVYLLPDLDEGDEKVLPADAPETMVEEDRPFTEPRASERAQESAEAVIDAAQGGDETPETLAELADEVTDRLDGREDARDQRNSQRRIERSLEEAGLSEESRELAEDAAERAADQVAEQVAEVVRETVRDAEPLPGESDAEAADRTRDRLREAADEVDYDRVVDDALNWARQIEQGDDQGAPTASEQSHARREVADALRADLFAMADQLAAMGDVDNANALSEVAARLAGKPAEEQVQRAIAAASMGRGPSRVRSLAARIRGMFTRARERFLDRVRSLMGLGAKAKRSLKAAVAAARAEWNGDDEAVRALVADAAAKIAAGGDQVADAVATVEPTGFAERLAYWREQLPTDSGMFGRTEAPRRAFRGLTLARLRGGEPVTPEETTGSRLDRAADGGPGATAQAHYDAVKGLGRAMDDEVAARVRALVPELGDDPAATVREAVRYAEEMARDERGDLNDEELTKLRRKARHDAAMKQMLYAQAKADATREALTQVRDMGPRGAARLNVQGRSEDAPEVQALRWAEQFIPTDWLTTAGTVEAQAGRMGSYRDGTITVAPLTEGLVEGSGRYGKSALHGLAHHLEQSVPGLSTAAWVHHWARTSDGEPGSRTRRGRFGLAWLRDRFPAAGFTTDDGTVRWAWEAMEDAREEHYEWVPAGFEDLFGDGTQDDDLRQFMLGLLAWLERTR